MITKELPLACSVGQCPSRKEIIVDEKVWEGDTGEKSCGSSCVFYASAHCRESTSEELLSKYVDTIKHPVTISQTFSLTSQCLCNRSIRKLATEIGTCWREKCQYNGLLLTNVSLLTETLLMLGTSKWAPIYNENNDIWLL